MKSIYESMNSKEMRERDRIWDNDSNNGDPNREPQHEANYVDKTSGSETCATCVYFQPDTESLGTCLKVKGVISASGHSDYYEGVK